MDSYSEMRRVEYKNIVLQINANGKIIYCPYKRHIPFVKKKVKIMDPNIAPQRSLYGTKIIMPGTKYILEVFDGDRRFVAALYKGCYIDENIRGINMLSEEIMSSKENIINYFNDAYKDTDLRVVLVEIE